MAYVDKDVWKQARSNIKKNSKPVKKYEDEVRRRSNLLNWEQIARDYSANEWTRNNNAKELNSGVTNAQLNAGNIRGSYTGDAITEGMNGINDAYNWRVQDIGAQSTAQLNNEWAYANMPKGGGGGVGRKPLSAAPTDNSNAVAYATPGGSSPTLPQAYNSGVVPARAAANYTGTTVAKPTTPAYRPSTAPQTQYDYRKLYGRK